MLRKIVILFMSLLLCCTTIACSGSSTSMQSQSSSDNNAVRAAPSSISSISDGKYPIQQATYDDVSGEYSLMLLNTPAGISPIFQTTEVQMARIDESAASNGEKTYLQVDDGQPIMYLTEDFKIEYVHNVTETQNNPQTGQPQTVVVRRESNFWTPFAGALAGQAIGSMLFRPQYYVPPIYQSGRILTGHGGYGGSYSQAVNRYQERYNAPPAAVKNSKTVRTTGSVRNASNKPSKSLKNNSRATGSGVGSSTLRSSGKSKQFKRSRGSFGSSSGIRRPTRSFGSRRRR